MSVAFDVTHEDVYIEAEQIEDTDYITLRVIDPEEGTVDLTVEAADLVRALISTSPAFAREVGALARAAIISYLEREADPEPDEE